MRQHVLGLAAQEQALEALAAVRSHHDEVAFVLLGSGDHRFGHQVGLGYQSLDGHALRAAFEFDAIDQALCRGGPLRLNLLDVLGIHGQRAFHVAARVARNHFERHHGCARQSRERNCALHGFLGKVRAVGGNEDALVHGEPLLFGGETRMAA